MKRVEFDFAVRQPSVQVAGHVRGMFLRRMDDQAECMYEVCWVAEPELVQVQWIMETSRANASPACCSMEGATEAFRSIYSRHLHWTQ